MFLRDSQLARTRHSTESSVPEQFVSGSPLPLATWAAHSESLNYGSRAPCHPIDALLVRRSQHTTSLPSSRPRTRSMW